jgi:hypothetical protein
MKMISRRWRGLATKRHKKHISVFRFFVPLVLFCGYSHRRRGEEC